MAENYRKVTEFKDVESFSAYIGEQGYHIGFAPEGRHEALAQTAECLGKTLGNPAHGGLGLSAGRYSQ